MTQVLKRVGYALGYMLGGCLMVADVIAIAMIIGALSVLFSGCYLPVDNSDHIDERLRLATLSAFVDARSPVRCDSTEYVHVAVVDDTSPYCLHGVDSCLLTLSGLNPRSQIVVASGLGHQRTSRLVIHELLHAARGCWVTDQSNPDEYLERYQTGERDDCHVRTAEDPHHCDTVLWRDIQAEATRRYEAY